MITKEERIAKEYKRLDLLFKGMGDADRAAAEELIKNSAFLAITLQDLQASINESGTVDTYQNGENQHGTKASAELQAYNQTLKSYSMVQKQLFSLLPKQQVKKSALSDILAELESELDT